MAVLRSSGASRPHRCGRPYAPQNQLATNLQKRCCTNLSAMTPHQQKELFDTRALPKPSVKRL